MATVSPSEIDSGTIYHVDEFRRRVGWGVVAFRTAKRKGLRTIRTAGRCYVRGKDFEAYLDQLVSERSEDA